MLYAKKMTKNLLVKGALQEAITVFLCGQTASFADENWFSNQPPLCRVISVYLIGRPDSVP